MSMEWPSSVTVVPMTAGSLAKARSHSAALITAAAGGLARCLLPRSAAQGGALPIIVKYAADTRATRMRSVSSPIRNGAIVEPSSAASSANAAVPA